MHKRKRLLRDFLLYLLGFLLLLEWLYPVSYMTYTDEIWLFTATTALFFVITFLRLPIFISIMIRVALVVGTLFWLFPETGPGESWISMFVDDLFYNIMLLTSGNLVEITDLHRTLLFLLLLSILSYLLFYWIIHARRILLFLFISIVYISTIDTFTDYNGSWAIVRIFVIGLLLLGLLHLLKRGEQQGSRAVYSFRTVGRSFALIGVFIIMAASIGYAMPKPEPQWPDPLPYIQSVFGFSSGIGTPVQRIGYSGDDRFLGGGFVQDDTPVFIAEVEDGQYWKGESKDVYTGTGWELSDMGGMDQRSVVPPIYEAGARFAEVVELEEKQANIQFYNEGEQQFNHLFYPGELTSQSVNDLITDDIHPIQVDPFSDMATLVEGDFPPNRYELTFYDRTFKVEGLEEVGRPDLADEETLANYLELPGNLPDRVGELAEEITANADNQYEMALAIERYLSGPQFEYETEDVPVPEQGQDYVDQFLFETLRGYCDNFSTSMAVMLRTLDIPTKWVKGFTDGEDQGVVEEREGYNQYLVSNNNAHSWVEVYFPDAGWVPFEPTPSFSGFEFQQPEIELETPNEDDLDAEEPEASDQELPEETEMEDETTEVGTLPEEDNGNSSTIGFFTIAGAGFALLLVIVFLCRKSIARFYVKQTRITEDQPESLARSYERLIWLLSIYGLKRKDTQTLTEYAKYVDEQLGSGRMSELTYAYEQFLYSSTPPTFNKARFKENWKNILEEIKS